jgi:hypothetical protein
MVALDWVDLDAGDFHRNAPRRGANLLTWQPLCHQVVLDLTAADHRRGVFAGDVFSVAEVIESGMRNDYEIDTIELPSFVTIS